MHGVNTPLLLPRGNIRDAQVATIKNGHPMHCAQVLPAEPQRMGRARVEKKTKKRRQHTVRRRRNKERRHE